LLHGYISSGRDEAQEAVVEWVKANEKIELLTGAQDSPTLKATAQPWAPSEAALAAAQEFKEKTTQSSISVDSGLNQSAEEEEDDFEEDHVSFSRFQNPIRRCGLTRDFLCRRLLSV
jgi:hypothetical protein